MNRSPITSRPAHHMIMPSNGASVTDVLIDLENLFPGGWWTHNHEQLMATTVAAIEMSPAGARVLVVSCGALAARVLDALLEHRVDVRAVAPTIDASDKRIEEHMAALPPDRHVLLLTGDGGLAGITATRTREQSPVIVASEPARLSRRLRSAATEFLPFRPPRRPTTSTSPTTTIDLGDAA